MVIDDAGLRDLLREALVPAGQQERSPDDAEALLERIALTARARLLTDALLREAVADARAAGCTWESIGRGLGITGQAAERAYGAHEAGRGPGDDPAAGPVLKLAPLYAFNEMSVLENAGRYGWHAVGSGSGMHLVRQDAVQWEHRRVLLAPAAGRALERDGWQRWTPGWFPWAYFNRPTGRPAEPEPPDLDLMRP